MTILFEVYTKRAIHEPIADLVLLDRDTSLKKARASARQWGGCVVKVQARILSRNPFTREILASEIVWIHKPRKGANQARDEITHKQLMGKIRSNSKSLYRGFRR